MNYSFFTICFCLFLFVTLSVYQRYLISKLEKERNLKESIYQTVLKDIDYNINEMYKILGYYRLRFGEVTREDMINMTGIKKESLNEYRRIISEKKEKQQG